MQDGLRQIRMSLCCESCKATVDRHKAENRHTGNEHKSLFKAGKLSKLSVVCLLCVPSESQFTFWILCCLPSALMHILGLDCFMLRCLGYLVFKQTCAPVISLSFGTFSAYYKNKLPNISHLTSTCHFNDLAHRYKHC